MVLDEIRILQNKIKLFEHVLDCLNVKLFYLQNKRSENEFIDNENRLEIIKVSHRVELQKGKLHFLYSEFTLQFEIFISENNGKSTLTTKDIAPTQKTEPIAICIIINDNYRESIFAIENLIAKTRHPIKLYIFNFNPKAVTYLNFMISHICNYHIFHYDTFNCKNYSLGTIYNEFIESATEKFAVFFPTNLVVNENWLSELKFNYNGFEKSGCISIKENIEDLKLSSLLFQNGVSEDLLRTVYVDQKNFFKDFLFVELSKAKEVGKFIETEDLKGLELSEWSFRFFANGYNNYYIKYENAIRLKLADEFLYPQLSKQIAKRFTEIANKSLTIEKTTK
jgi:hypothetical protein